MPQITVDYSDTLSDTFDHTALAQGLHTAAVEIAAAKSQSCKTLFRPSPATAVGHEDSGHAIIHITIGLLAGRTDETKAQLTEAALEVVRKHVRPRAGLALHASTEIRDLDASYRKFDA